MAVLAAVCAKVPEAKLGIIFLPMVTFTAGNVSVEENVHISKCVNACACACVCALMTHGVHYSTLDFEMQHSSCV